MNLLFISGECLKHCSVNTSRRTSSLWLMPLLSLTICAVWAVILRVKTGLLCMFLFFSDRIVHSSPDLWNALRRLWLMLHEETVLFCWTCAFGLLYIHFLLFFWLHCTAGVGDTLWIRASSVFQKDIVWYQWEDEWIHLCLQGTQHFS